MDESTEYTYEVLGLTAPGAYWRALGATVYTNGKVAQLSGADSLLIQGIAATDGSGPAVIAWALAERTRRVEEHNRNAAVEALAKAMVESGRQEALDAILPNLSENLQYALRKQLKGSGYVLS